MDIINLTQKFIAKRKKQAFRRDRNRHGLTLTIEEDAWMLGWNAAMRFARKVNKAHGICEQCGKLIVSENDLCLDADCAMFCKKCFEKVFCGEDDKKLLCWNDMSQEEKSDFFYNLSHQK